MSCRSTEYCIQCVNSLTIQSIKLYVNNDFFLNVFTEGNKTNIVIKWFKISAKKAQLKSGFTH